MEVKPKGDTIVVKEYFGLNTQQAIEIKKSMDKDEIKQLADGIRDGSLIY
jgi:hypothetical protein